MDLQTIVDVVDGTTTYKGYADPGRATTDPYWQIQKITTAGGVVTTMYPCGAEKLPSANFDFRWSERATLHFSLIPDVILPTLTTVSIASNNSDTARAKVGDTVTITMVGSEKFEPTTVTIAGHAATLVAGSTAKEWTANYVMATGDTAGTVAYSIAFKDASGNYGVTVTGPTDASAVTFDKTAPTMVSVAKNSVTELELTLSELAIDSTITKANNGGFTVSETGTPATTYAVSAIAPGGTDDKVVLTIADCTLSAAAGLTVKYTAGGNGTVTDLAGNALATNSTGLTIAAWDAAPTMVSAERLAATTLKVFLSEDASDATITKSNDGGFTVHETGAPATTYAVSAIAKSGSNSDEIELTVADVTASAAAGLTVKYTAGGNGTVTDAIGIPMATNATGVVVAPW